MSNNLKGFEDQAHRVSYAYDNTQRQYDEHPPNDDVVPIAAAINAWTLICEDHNGVLETQNGCGKKAARSNSVRLCGGSMFDTEGEKSLQNH